MYTLRKTSVLTLALALVLALLIGAFALMGDNKSVSAADNMPTDAGAPSGDGITPTLITQEVDNSVHCNEVGLVGTFREFKVDPVTFGPHTDGPLTVNLTSNTLTDPIAGPGFNWTSNLGIDAVIVKGGPGTDTYVYTPAKPEDLGDTKLHAPVNNDPTDPDNGKYYGLSHITFCYDLELEVSKTAQTSLDRTYSWMIDKSADQTDLTLEPDEQSDINYTITLSNSHEDSNHAVEGVITITNPDPDNAATVTGVTDQITGGINAEVTCDGEPFPITIPASGTLECHYSADLSDDSDRTNTATVTTSGAVGGGSGTAEVNFDNATVNEIDESVDVEDSFAGLLGDDVNANDPPEDLTFTYPRTVSYDECGNYDVDNTASFTTNDTGTTGEDTANVDVTVLCNVNVEKTVSGQAPAAGQNFTFQLREGASNMSNGQIRETKTTDSSGKIAFSYLLVPGQPYQICELVFPGWNTNLGNGSLFVPNSIIPPNLPNQNVDNVTVCHNFTAQGQTFNVDNTPPPGGRALTIGFWKNWASCSGSGGTSGGKQKPMLDLALGMASKNTTNPPGGLVVSATTAGAGWPNYATEWKLVLKGNKDSMSNNILSAPDCAKAVNLLNKSTITGTKKANDPLFNMTAQLVAAQLNRFMGAGISGPTITNIDKAVLLNGKHQFNGSGYTGKPDANLANCLATQLDNYNNNRPVSSC